MVNAVPNRWKEWSELGKGNKDDVHIGHNLIKVNSNLVSLEKITCRDIYNCLVNCKEIKNVNKNTWEHRLIDVQLDWDQIFSKQIICILLPRNVWDFNWYVFYGVINTESRLQKMKLSDGMCQLCLFETEDVYHVLYGCIHVKDVWVKVESKIRKYKPDYTPSYNQLILGNSCIVTNCVLCIGKWNVWKRRNNFIFDGDGVNDTALWKTYVSSMHHWIFILRRTKFINKIKWRDIIEIFNTVEVELK
jgi:hypothetical protein